MLQLPAGSLEVEITEGALIRDPANAKKVLSGLRRLGVSVALDDFGTGYSSLAYLRRFPIDRIKLDRSFVRELPETRETAAIVRAIRDLASALGVELIAEGIEREAEAHFLLADALRRVIFIASRARLTTSAPGLSSSDWLRRRRDALRAFRPGDQRKATPVLGAGAVSWLRSDQKGYF